MPSDLYMMIRDKKCISYMCSCNACTVLNYKDVPSVYRTYKGIYKYKLFE